MLTQEENERARGVDRTVLPPVGLVGVDSDAQATER